MTCLYGRCNTSLVLLFPSLLLQTPMALTLEQPLLKQRSMPASILLNPPAHRNYTFTLVPPVTSFQHQQPTSSSSSIISSRSEASSQPTDTNSSANGGSSRTGIHPTGRKVQVKFAPLPDPRKLEEEELEAKSITSDLSEEAAYNESRGIKFRSLPVSPLLGGKATLYDSGDNGSAAALAAIERSPRWSTKRLLRPLLPKSSNNAPSPDTTTNLFRPSSMESITSTHSSSGSAQQATSLGLSTKNRSTSDLEHQRVSALRARSSSGASLSTSTTNSIVGGAAGLLAKMSPLTHATSEVTHPSSNSSHSYAISRTQSNQSSYGGKGANGGAIRRTRSNSSSQAQGKDNKRRFMLNGRVYGQRRGGLTPDPFSHQRAYEQEFVEWGSGGLGSVPASRAAGAAADWDRVRGTPETKPREVNTEEFDDGSGMGWVRRRREARERAKLEEDLKAKQAKQKQAAAPPAENNAPVHSKAPDHHPTEDLPCDGDGVTGAESISRPRSSASVRTANNTLSMDVNTPIIPSASTSSSIPDITIHPASHVGTPNTGTPTPASTALPSTSTSTSNATSVSASSPTPASANSKPEHQMDLAVVPPHRRSSSTHHGHHHKSPVSALPSQGQHQYEREVALPEEEEVGGDSATLREKRPVMDDDGSESRSSTSRSEDEEEEDDDESGEKDEDNEDDEEEEEMTEAQKRLTAECAGVEKMVRHRETREREALAASGN